MSEGFIKISDDLMSCTYNSQKMENLMRSIFEYFNGNLEDCSQTILDHYDIIKTVIGIVDDMLVKQIADLDDINIAISDRCEALNSVGVSI